METNMSATSTPTMPITNTEAGATIIEMLTIMTTQGLDISARVSEIPETDLAPTLEVTLGMLHAATATVADVMGVPPAMLLQTMGQRIAAAPDGHYG